LNISWQVLEYIFDLFLETTLKHLIGFIKDEKFKVICFQESSLHHVENATGGSNNNLDTTLQNFDVFFNNSSTNASVDFDSTDFSDLVHDEGNLHGELTSG
jgi:hypothetical protein